MLRFCPIASGSSGNCIYVGTPNANILIDAGISGKSIASGLSKLSVNPSEIDAIFVTHDHSDHVKGAGIFSRRHKTQIHATKGTWNAMKTIVGEVNEQNIKIIDSRSAIKIKDIEIMPFTTPHDGAEPVGFVVLAEGVKISIATDLGHPADNVLDMISDSDIILLETNHDEEMLKRGPYPYYLKRRILSDKGHLSNKTAGQMLAKIASPKLKYIYLGHLSAENNSPSLAYDTVCETLKNRSGLDNKLNIMCAERTSVSKEICL